MGEKSLNQNGHLRSQVISSVTWAACLKYPGQILTWIITIIVIRILEPNDFGLFAEANIFVGLLTLFSELGLGGFIVQRKNIDTHLLSQVFGLMIVSNIICFLLLFFGAPFISKYFSEPRLTDILRALSIVFIFISFYFIPQSLLRRNMDFKSKSIVELIGTLCQSIICLVFALQGYGVWALVLGTISMHLVLIVGYNLASRNFVLPKIKLNGMKSIITFGGFMTGSNLLWYYYIKADVLISGYFLDSKLIGNFSVAKTIASLPMEKIFPIITQVALPAYSKIQSEYDQIQRYFLKSLRLASLTIMPIFFGLFVIVPEFVEFVLGNKWSDIIFPIQILCIIMPFRSLGSLFAPVLIGIGKPNINFINVSIIAFSLSLSFYFGVPYGINGICWAWVFGYGLAFLVVLKITVKTLGIPMRSILSAIWIPSISSVCMLISLVFIKHSIQEYLSPLFLLIICILLGFAIYVGIIFIIRKSTLEEIWALIPKKN